MKKLFLYLCCFINSYTTSVIAQSNDVKFVANVFPIRNFSVSNNPYDNHNSNCLHITPSPSSTMVTLEYDRDTKQFEDTFVVMSDHNSCYNCICVQLFLTDNDIDKQNTSTTVYKADHTGQYQAIYKTHNIEDENANLALDKYLLLLSKSHNTKQDFQLYNPTIITPDIINNIVI